MTTTLRLLVVLLAMSWSCAKAQEAQVKLAIAHHGRVIKVRVIEQPAYYVVVLQYALKPNAHDSEWYAFHEFPANVSAQSPEIEIPATGESVFFRTFQYQPTPIP